MSGGNGEKSGESEREVHGMTGGQGKGKIGRTQTRRGPGRCRPGPTVGERPAGNGRRRLAANPIPPSVTVTLDKFGRVLIPKRLRDRMGLVAGAEMSLDVTDAGDGGPRLELRHVSPAASGEALVREGSLLVHDGRPVGELDVGRLLRAQREARSLGHAGVAAPGP